MKAILFDLDETLYDHRHACSSGIRAIRELQPALQRKSIEELEFHFWKMLDRMYVDVIRGQVTQAESRLVRIRALFELCGAEAPEDELDQLVAVYRRAYVEGMRAIPGALELVTELREQGFRIAVITNGLTAGQQDKLQVCGLTPYVDVFVTAEMVGSMKPHPAMFLETLSRCEAAPQDVLMIGDSWNSDIVGASQVGVRGIWLNRRKDACPDPNLAPEIRELTEVRNLLPDMISFQSKGVQSV